MSAHLSTQNLTYRYKDGTVALNNVSLDFSQGAVTALIGANGAGKSTLFLNLLGILRPTEGQVQWQETPLQYSKKALEGYREQVNMVFQDPDKQIFFSKVEDDFAFALRNLQLSKEEIDQRVNTALEATQITSLRQKAVHYLSFGQKKRVALAGVLALRPKVLLLDEPTAGLDPAMTEEMINLIQQLRKHGTRLVVSSHDMDFIYRISDYVYVLEQGTVKSKGTPNQVFLDANLLTQCHLRQPWLVKLHSQTGLPLCKHETELYALLVKLKAMQGSQLEHQ